MCRETPPERPKVPTLDEIKKALPPSVFVKSLPTSLAYMAFDFAVFGSLMAAFLAFRNSTLAENALVYALGSILYWMLSGFYVWCIFVIGHDCGHTSFSHSWVANAVCGLIAHSAILVPFYPWARSHHFHHLHHQHETKDYSHPWMTEAKLKRVEEKTDGFMSSLLASAGPVLQRYKIIRMAALPIVYTGYLVAGVDGSHFEPFLFGGRLYKDARLHDKLKCVLCTACIALTARGAYLLLGSAFLPAYLVPVIIGHFWVSMVTYLQHHNEHGGTKVYDDSTFTYTSAAFDTIDRTYGGVIDFLHHRISDCHLVHHLFFTQIPHYHLREATDALEAFLQKTGYGHLYKKEETQDFPLVFLKAMYTHGMEAELVSDKLTAAAKGG
jgi:omega-3 fatty acid desaturase (delta-15 desaturase)